MTKIINLETATTNCSVSISVDGKLVSVKEENTPNYSHSEQLHIFIKEALEEASFSFADIDAIAVSKGPGSYTGLRIGVSAAKGLCFSLDLPLISIPTLESMSHQIKVEPNEVIIPVLDARRMEVYSCVFNHSHHKIRETKAEVIDENSFEEFSGYKKVHFLGSGAEKIETLLDHPNFKFHKEVIPSSKEMAKLSQKKFEVNDFEDVAYFEPYYLKDFILQTKKA
ncbi:tRNA (adenosine(37)-N6)-threonylcarbamoyltransferase complex dimerization subunit type 1 TsaB [Croceitalea sp. MTPC9]|uniref:tRNA (adenosine(37)-N6)-threonylcarbamoyltransferase complex dimerization subunit type 1 TsaB n=1 Tax=unclassified Croceitalea TaxID=2632280 RepID=UPI002B3AA956|nr:tRNA (adenosine(37)-N6)-threonylcarbamoyltransferase complex dimerization subunit type 1 TsaB [Croceitalea sp. MTPC6]GMN18344.1 tRNA (adenosine(37)-N6)-threonylcarbamoyltransferase complex dimerization subunit type 1 TsaB [Croceitalea sp. MTPC9]